MKPLLPLFLLLVTLFTAHSSIYGQISFSNQSSMLTTEDFHSIQPVGVADMNGDGLDDVIRLGWYTDANNIVSQKLCIEYQSTTTGQTFAQYTQDINSNPWGLCIADINHDGFNDLLYGGENDDLKLLMGTSNTALGTQTILSIQMFLQGVNFVDINNDGWLDIYACDDNQANTTYRNDGTGQFILDNTLIPHDPSGGNYASVWSDYDADGDLDLYISKCRAGASGTTSTGALNPERKNLFYRNNGNGSYNEVAQSFLPAPLGIADTGQSWAADFADIDNDGDMDLFVLNHPPFPNGTNADKSRLYKQITPTSFDDIMDNSGLPDMVYGDWQALFRDFDNDGWVDLIYTGSGPNYGIYRNNGDLTFTKITNAFPIALTIANCAVGDLNHDGFLDVYASYGSWVQNSPSTPQDRLWINEGNSNHFVAFQLTGVNSNKSAIGARLELYGDWGLQVREIRSGESYGINNSLSQHFGLGSHTTIDSLVIRWPSGIRQTETNLAIDEFHAIEECVTGDCTTAMPTVLRVQAKVLLEGPYFGNGEMTQVLRNKILLPFSTPYDEAPWNHAGNESVGQLNDMPFNATDWILLELQDINHNTVATASGFLTATGDVIGVDGQAGVSFSAISGNYYLAVRHRNHVDVVSSQRINVSAGVPVFYNFTIGGNVMDGANQLKDLNGIGLFGLKAGDYDGNGIVNVKDYNQYWNEATNTNQYLREDGNLDSHVLTNDFNLYKNHTSQIGVSAIRY